MDSIQVFEAFTELSKKAREEKRIISPQEFDNFARDYEVRQTRKAFIEEWWDFRFMKALRFINSDTSEEEYQESLKEFREEKERKRLERKKDQNQDAHEPLNPMAQKEYSDTGNPPNELNISDNPNQEDSDNDDINRESLKDRVGRLVEKLTGLL